MTSIWHSALLIPPSKSYPIFGGGALTSVLATHTTRTNHTLVLRTDVEIESVVCSTGEGHSGVAVESYDRRLMVQQIVAILCNRRSFAYLFLHASTFG